MFTSAGFPCEQNFKTYALREMLECIEKPLFIATPEEDFVDLIVGKMEIHCKIRW